jgi:hypothetical protein
MMQGKLNVQYHGKVDIDGLVIKNSCPYSHSIIT